MLAFCWIFYLVFPCVTGLQACTYVIVYCYCFSGLNICSVPIVLFGLYEIMDICSLPHCKDCI